MSSCRLRTSKGTTASVAGADVALAGAARSCFVSCATLKAIAVSAATISTAVSTFPARLRGLAAPGAVSSAVRSEAVRACLPERHRREPRR